MWYMTRTGGVQPGMATPVLGLGLSAHFRDKETEVHDLNDLLKADHALITWLIIH